LRVAGGDVDDRIVRRADVPITQIATGDGYRYGTAGRGHLGRGVIELVETGGMGRWLIYGNRLPCDHQRGGTNRCAIVAGGEILHHSGAGDTGGGTGRG